MIKNIVQKITKLIFITIITGCASYVFAGEQVLNIQNSEVNILNNVNTLIPLLKNIYAEHPLIKEAKQREQLAKDNVALYEDIIQVYKSNNRIFLENHYLIAYIHQVVTQNLNNNKKKDTVLDEDFVLVLEELSKIDQMISEVTQKNPDCALRAVAKAREMINRPITEDDGGNWHTNFIKAWHKMYVACNSVQREYQKLYMQKIKLLTEAGLY